MNPFTESTVAEPSATPADWRHHARASARSLVVGAALGVLSGASFAGSVDVNAATLDELQSLRGIGPRTAQTILDERRRAGPYASIEDLSDRVRGIGPRKAAALRASGLRVGPAYRMLRHDADSAPRTGRERR